MITLEQIEGVLAECTDSTVMRRRVAKAILALFDEPVQQQPAAVVGQETLYSCWGVYYDGKGASPRAGWVQDHSGCPALFNPKERAEQLACPSDNYKPRELHIVTAPVPAAGVQGDDDQQSRYIAAIDSVYPIPDNPHNSVIQRAMDDRIAFRKGWEAGIAKGQPDSGRDASLRADEERQSEAHKLARILFGMVEGDGRVEGVNIYADGYSAPDGDVFVLRAAELLIEQAAESKELTRYVEHFALAAHPANGAQADKKGTLP